LEFQFFREFTRSIGIRKNSQNPKLEFQFFREFTRSIGIRKNSQNPKLEFQFFREFTRSIGIRKNHETPNQNSSSSVNSPVQSEFVKILKTPEIGIPVLP
jgi:endo-1,4-beta-mannosidase